MGTRITSEILYLRHEFSNEERLEMGAKLAESYNRMAEIEDEEAVMKAQIKDRKSGVDAAIGTLSRNLAAGFTMENIKCDIKYDHPNVGEVTYVDPNGKEVKSRPMTQQERQLDLPLSSEDKTVAAEADKSASNIVEFFNKDAHPLPDEPQDESEDDYGPDTGEDEDEDEGDDEDEQEEPTQAEPETANEEENLLDPKHDAEFAAVEKPKRGRPKGIKGFNKPTNATGISDDF